MIDRNRLAPLAFLAAAVGCGEGPGHVVTVPPLTYGPASNQLFEPPDTRSGGGIVGDWFQCEDLGCRQLDGDGARFTEDGRVIPLDARGDLDPEESYCDDLSEGIGQYRLEGSTLLLIDPNGQELVFEVKHAGDRLMLELSGQTVMLLRIDPPRSTGPCRSGGQPTPDAPSRPDAPPPPTEPGGG